MTQEERIKDKWRFWRPHPEANWIWRQHASSFWDDIRIDRVLPQESRDYWWIDAVGDYYGAGCVAVCYGAGSKETAQAIVDQHNLRRAIEEGWDWNWIAMRADYYIDEGLPILSALETGGDPETCDSAVNTNENAVGRYQIRPIMIDEVNRILGKPAFTLEDRNDRIRASMIARTYLKYWLPRRFGNDFQPQHIAILWKGGSNPRSWGTDTEAYAMRYMELWLQVHPED